jgi:hypothetical protein
MRNNINRKDFEKRFKSLNENGVKIWVINRVKVLPIEIVNMAERLSELEFINYVRICDETLSASSENYPNKPKVPITHMNHETAIGIQILYNTKHKYVDFFDINSPIKGHGSKMVEAILKDFPKDWNPTVVMDYSNGFWEKIEEKYNHLEWI